VRASAHTLGLAVGIVLFGCGSQDELAESAPIPPAVVEEFSVEDIVIGDGPECQSPSEIVSIHYRGMLLDGQMFDSSYERGVPIVASLDSLIPGWQQGIPGMRVGGKRRLTVPEDLAYSGMAALQYVKAGGSSGAGQVLIPPKSTLVFEIELLAIGPPEDPEKPSDIARSTGD
jgi:peptidylprolyl isomerase